MPVALRQSCLVCPHYGYEGHGCEGPGDRIPNKFDWGFLAFGPSITLELQVSRKALAYCGCPSCGRYLEGERAQHFQRRMAARKVLAAKLLG